MDVFERATADIEAGRLWKARDRLHGYLAFSPADQEALNLLGEVFFRMGDLPSAGAHWFLTERADGQAEAAQKALYERHSKNAVALLSACPIRASINAYPAPVQTRLRSLAKEAEVSGVLFPPVRKLRRIGGKPSTYAEKRRRLRTRILEAGTVAMLLLGTVGVWLVGLGFLVWIVGRALT